MALFGFSDITFDKGTTSRKGPLGSLVGSQYETNTLKYPIDIGNADKSHYMVFYIREQRNTKFVGTPAKDFTDADYAQAGVTKQLISGLPGMGTVSLGQQLLGKINSGLSQINAQTNGALKGLTGALGKAASGFADSVDNVLGQASISIGGNSAATSAHIDTSIKKITGGSLGLLRTTRLTTDAIALYMPDTLNYSYTQSYDTPSLGSEAVGKVLAAGKSVIDKFKEGDPLGAGGSVFKSIGLEAGKAITSLAGEATGGALFTAATGTVSNPMLEMVYKSPGFRHFQFEFTFYPRDEREALEVQRIIERFRFHQAPELVEGAAGFLIPPSEFDIKFYYAGAMNPNIPSIATCVLSQIDVNYTPNGFTAYEVPGENKPALGRTGMPVAIQLMLQFQETTFLTKDDFNSGRTPSAKKSVSVSGNSNEALSGGVNGFQSPL
jgi:hypothetical protein